MITINYKKKLGEGSFSKVYEGEDKNGKKYAVKIEEKGKNDLLKKEAMTHYFLSTKDKDNEHIIPIHYFSEDDEKSFLVTERMYLSLGNIIKKIDSPFDILSINNIANKLIKSLQFIHKNGVCHGDIKPDNIIISRDYLKIYLIDFGLSSYYIKNGKHISFRNELNPSGTLRYLSVNVNNNEMISRRDDLISLGYVFVYLQKLFLPWQNIGEKNKFEKVGEMKRKVDLEKLCEGCVSGLYPYLKYCYKLGFKENPDYEYLLKLFELKTN